MNKLLLVGVLAIVISAVGVRAECVNGEVIDSDNSQESDVSLFFKNVACSLQKTAAKVQENAKKLGGEIKEGAKKFKENAKKFGSDVKTKFEEIKDKITSGSIESAEEPHSLLSNVEIVNPEILMAEQKCGEGFILDALNGCKKN